MTTVRRSTTAPMGHRSDGWRTAAWVVVVAALLVVVFAGVILASAISDDEPAGGDDSLAPLGLIVAAVVAAPAVLALGMVAMSFVRQLAPSASKALVSMAAALLVVEAFACANWFI